jgi:hypothetical protein
MKTLPVRPFHLAILGAAFLLSACDVRVGEGGFSLGMARGRATDEWTRTYTVAPGGQLEIVNTNGLIELSPAMGPEVEVRASREVRANSDEAAREDLQKLQILEEIAPDRVKVETRTNGRTGFMHGPRVTVEYRVRVPAGLRVSVKTENGGVRIENVDGRFVAATTNGGVTARGISGALEATSVNGGIQLDLASVTGDVRAVTVNGGVRLELPSDVKAEIEAGTVNGGVSIDDRFDFSGDRDGTSGVPGGPKRLSGKINGGGHKISVHTTNGGVRVAARGAPRRET